MTPGTNYKQDIYHFQVYNIVILATSGESNCINFVAARSTKSLQRGVKFHMGMNWLMIKMATQVNLGMNSKNQLRSLF